MLQYEIYAEDIKIQDFSKDEVCRERNQKYERPDFVSEVKCSTVRMCDVFFENMSKTKNSEEEQAYFWKTYRSPIG